MFFKRLTLPLIIVFGIGVLAFVQEFVPHPWSNMFREEMTTWFRVIGGFAMFLGAYSLFHMHVSRIRHAQAGWGYSVFVFIGAAAMIIVGLVNEGSGPLGPDEENGLFDWGYNFVYVPCQATIFSILAFFMASAAFRTFRARNVAAAMLLVAAVIVMFGRVPISEALSSLIFGDAHRGVFSTAADVINNYPNMAAKRAIILGFSLGGIAQSLRILFGIERSYLGGGD